jgi:hypothetical protein
VRRSCGRSVSWSCSSCSRMEIDYEGTYQCRETHLHGRFNLDSVVQYGNGTDQCGGRENECGSSESCVFLRCCEWYRQWSNKFRLENAYELIKPQF